MLAEQVSETVQKIQTVTSEEKEAFTNVSINAQELFHFDNKVTPFIGMMKYSMLEIQKAIENVKCRNRVI